MSSQIFDSALLLHPHQHSINSLSRTLYSRNIIIIIVLAIVIILNPDFEAEVSYQELMIDS